MASGINQLFQPIGAPAIQRCADCNSEYSETISAAVCTTCGGLLEVRNPAPSDASGRALTGADLRRTFAQDLGTRTLGRGSGVWRYEKMVMPAGSRLPM